MFLTLSQNILITLKSFDEAEQSCKPSTGWWKSSFEKSQPKLDFHSSKFDFKFLIRSEKKTEPFGTFSERVQRNL
ncbi:hypothetical protein HQ39_08745 [Porphyromonas sp. COT-108 OH2963]|nr:hypothetical protein HQ39_08745 [Porphyromonas sp. COT-108 OH2963]